MTTRIAAPVIKTHRVDSPLPMTATLIDGRAWFSAVVNGETYVICGKPDPVVMREESVAMVRVPHSSFTYCHAMLLNRFISFVLRGSGL